MKKNLKKLEKTSPSSVEWSQESTKQETPRHESVLLQEVLHYLRPRSGGFYVDGTVGLGGHSFSILEYSAPQGFLLGLDWNRESLKIAEQRLAPFKGRYRLLRANFALLKKILEREKWGPVDGILLDLGLSSYLLEHSKRGFSFLRDEPLDMRMDETLSQTALDLVHNLSFLQLKELLRSYGEERWASRIAKAICEFRRSQKIVTSKQLAEIVAKAVPASRRRRRLHPATKTFQALRIAVNKELDNLKEFLDQVAFCLKSGARVVIISFHSLEDRLVKHSFKKNPFLKVITKKPLTPSSREIENNPRARSAKLRVAEKI